MIRKKGYEKDKGCSGNGMRVILCVLRLRSSRVTFARMRVHIRYGKSRFPSGFFIFPLYEVIKTLYKICLFMYNR